MEHKHTPGPWLHDCGEIKSASGDIVFDLGCGCCSVKSELSDADAKLICAAPDMLAMLRKLYTIEMNEAISLQIFAVIGKAEGWR